MELTLSVLIVAGIIIFVVIKFVYNKDEGDTKV